MLLYLALTGHLPVPPAAFVGGLAVAAAPLCLGGGRTWKVLRSPMALWVAAYLAVGGMAFVATPVSKGSLTALASMIAGAGFLMLMMFVLADAAALRVARGMLVALVLVGVVVNLYDLLHPLAFSPFVGRAAGLYVNPNIAAIALVLGMVASLEAVPARWQTGYVLATGVGVFVTLSRTGIIGWVVALAGLLWTGVLRWRVLFQVVAALVILGLVTLQWTGELGALAARLSTIGNGPLERLALQGDFSTKVRYDVAVEALRLFAAHPLAGGGLGATLEWRYPESTHNMYLRLLAEMGLIGVIIYPGAALMALWRPRGAVPAAGRVFLAVWLLFGLFSHNMLEDRPVLTVLALFAAESVVALGAIKEETDPKQGVDPA
ncbi:MAG TPA: O-antigen ligase family protein [Gemmatimonadales bacterium]|nr:O-antigen ligase family protein [Gemmatimonadales bacterium]